MNTLVYLLYGTNQDYHTELSTSILSATSFLKQNPCDIRIALLCGPGNERHDLPVINVPVSDSEIQRWQLDGEYNHAAQAFALGFALEHFPGRSVLVDTDTLFSRHPKLLFERIQPGRTLMHVREGTLADSRESAFWRLLHNETRGRLCRHEFNLDTFMYNAGVLGAHSDDIYVVREIQEVTAFIRTLSKVFTAVQLAASVVFQRATQLGECGDVVDHYWGGPRAFYRYQMEKLYPVRDKALFDKLSARTLSLARSPRRPPGAVIRAALKHRILGESAEYAYAYSAYLSALASSDADPRLAAVWARNALSLLKFGAHARSSRFCEDFTAFSPEQIDSVTWLDENQKTEWRKYWMSQKS